MTQDERMLQMVGFEHGGKDYEIWAKESSKGFSAQAVFKGRPIGPKYDLTITEAAEDFEAYSGLSVVEVLMGIVRADINEGRTKAP